MTRWALLTGEYPPQPGGVADYTRLVARGLAAAGDDVTVYAPPTGCGGSLGDGPEVVVRLPDTFGPRGLPALEAALGSRRPDRILVQYVPHAYGYKAMNLPFAAWIAARAGRFARPWVVFHEVAFPFSWRPPSHAVLGVVTVVMARLVAGAAGRVFVTTPAWGSWLRGICPRAEPAEWLPIPANITPDDATMAEPCPGGGGSVIGHFGTYGPLVTALLEPALRTVLGADPGRVGLLLGRGGMEFRERVVAGHPGLAGRLIATGDLPPAAVARHLRGCDLLLQPFPDGITTRRTSAMAGLATARPVVSNLGAFTEPFWSRSGCVRLAPTPDPVELASAAEAVLALTPGEREAMGRAAATLYRNAFSLEHTLTRLRCPDTPR